ncbi:MAG: hypothetical protein AUH43_05135 [Acidobacteria bacterium 13_1_40CM_65_14]|nr:MAG: hypothetical protein AUH43_05135 [Acidobacteria bacterium 13_1_40CM_65_14]
MKPPILVLVCITLVAAFQVRLAAAVVAVSQDVPVPGGTAALAHALAIDPVPDRGRFISELTRLVYDTDARNPTAVAFLNSLRLPVARGKKMTLPFDHATFDLVPVPLTAELWSNAVFRRKVAPEGLVMAIIADRQAALVCHGLGALDDETLQFFAEHESLISRLYERNAPMFAVFSGSLHIRANRVVPPGGAGAVVLWEAVVGEKVTRPERFVLSLFDLSEGRVAYLFDVAGQIDPARREFLLGSWIGDPAARLERFKQLATAGMAAFRDWHVRTLPYGRATHDLATALMRLTVAPNGALAPPASRAWWSRAFAAADLPDDGSAPKLTDDQPIDAAWLAETIGGADVRQRGERLDQLAFAQRLFGAMTDDGGDAEGGAFAAAPAFVAVRAVPHYRMLMLTLERTGVRSPAVYAAAARHASRLTSLDGSKGFTAQSQFQGALALVARMVEVRTIDPLRAESLIERLVATSVNGDGRYGGAIARWLQDAVGVIGSGSDVESAIVRALGGAASAEPHDSVHITWEGQKYRLDLGFAERRRLERVRQKQQGLPIDVPLEIAAIARRLTGDAVSTADVDAAAALLTTLVSDLPRRSRVDTTAGPPAGVGVSPELQEVLRKALEELTRASRNRDAKRAARVAAPLVDAADGLLARALLSFTYAMYVGDPEGTVLLAGDVSHRHDFGFGVKDGVLRARTAWSAPRQDVAPGVPWHVSGSLLGLDLALAPLALRRLNFDHLMHAPKLTSNERDTFAMSVALMNPYALRDADRDAIAAAVARGAVRVLEAMTDPPALDAIADAIAIDPGRRRALEWTLANDRQRFPSMFTLSEQLFLGGGGGAAPGAPGVDLNAWGMSALGTAGCICTRLTPPGRWWVLTGRPQLGIVAAALPDLNLHVAARLKELRVPAALARVVVSAAMQDFLDEVQPTDDSDWLTLSREARTATREQIEDYLASATADGPLVPVSSQP